MSAFAPLAIEPKTENEARLKASLDMLPLVLADLREEIEGMIRQVETSIPPPSEPPDLSSVVILAPAASSRNVIQPTGAAVLPFAVRAHASQSANLLELQSSGGTALVSFDSNGDFQLLRSDAGSVDISVRNTGGGPAQVSITADTGDPKVIYTITSGSSWSHGPDNSDSDAWVLSQSTALGTNNNLRIATGGDVSILRGNLDVTWTNNSVEIGVTLNNTGGAGNFLRMVGSGPGARSIYFQSVARETWRLYDVDALRAFRIANNTGTVVEFSNTGITTFNQGDVNVVRSSAGDVIFTTSNSSSASASGAKIIINAATNGSSSLLFQRAGSSTRWSIIQTNSSDQLAFDLLGTTAAHFDSNRDFNLASGTDIILSTVTGTKIGTSTSQLLGFWNATPVDQPAHIADPSGGGTQDAEARTAIGAILDLLEETGLMAP